MTGEASSSNTIAAGLTEKEETGLPYASSQGASTARAVRMVIEHAGAHESQWAAMTSIAETSPLLVPAMTGTTSVPSDY